MDNANQPATKADLAALEERVGKRFEDLEGQVRNIRESLSEAIHDSETRLLKAFYTFAESNQVRLAQVENTTNAVITRMATLEARVTEVEKRLNMPPQKTQ
jgi:cell wall assembly regulator SMI1